MLSRRIASSLFAVSLLRVSKLSRSCGWLLSSQQQVPVIPKYTTSVPIACHMMMTRSRTTTTKDDSTKTTSSSNTGNQEEEAESDKVEFVNPDDTTIRTILTQTRTVAMIGASNRPERDSYHVMEYLMKECGYRVIPINPMYTDTTILNQKVYGTLTEVLQKYPNTVDMIDIFRRSSDVPEIINELLQYQPEETVVVPVVGSTVPQQQQQQQQLQLPKYIWMQINVIHDPSAILAQQRGYHVVMNKCPLHEIPRLQIPLPIVVP